MSVPFFIAFRYLFSKKNISIINIIASIATLGIAITTAALLIILSVFNGLEDIIVSHFNSFNPEIKASLVSGKYFEIDQNLRSNLKSCTSVDQYSFVLEDYAAIKHHNTTHPFMIKGVDEQYQNINGIDSMLLQGEFKLKSDSNSFAVLGYEVSKKLSVNIYNPIPLQIYVPKRHSNAAQNPIEAFNKRLVYPVGVFGIDETADQYSIVSLDMAQTLFEAENQASQIEIKLKPNQNLIEAQNEISQKLGAKFLIKNRQEQNSFYKILNSERLMIYLILGFVLLIATFNIMATLTMMMLDKQNDFVTFTSIGLSHYQIKMVFFLNGLLTSFMGLFIGLLLGGILSWIQIEYGIVKFGDGLTSIEAYPIKLIATDFLKVTAMVSLVCLISSLVPLIGFKKRFL